MKILQLITRDHNRTGSGIQMMQLSLELENLNHDVTALYRFNPDRDEDFTLYEDSGVCLVRMPMVSTRLRSKSIKDVFELRQFIKKNNFDLIHTHSNASNHALLATINMNIPIVVNRGMGNKLNFRKGLKYRSPKIRKIIAVSENTRDVMVETGGIQYGKISVVYGSVDTNRFSPEIKGSASRENLGLNDSHYIVGYCGSICARKGINFLLSGFAKFSESNPLARLLWVGVDRETLMSKHSIPEDLSGKIIFTGFQHEPEKYMCLFDVFLFAGTRNEGLTGAIREAAAMKIPIISTDVGGNRELIFNQRRGLLINDSSVSEITNALEFASNNPNKMQVMANESFEFIQEFMSIKNRALKVEKIYKEVMEHCQRQSA